MNGTLGIEKILKLYGLFLRMELNGLKATQPFQEDSLIFTNKLTGVASSFDRLLKDKRLSRFCSEPVI